MTEQERLAAALEYQGVTAAPPTMAQQLAKVPSRLIGALKALGTGSSYGSAEPVNAVNDLARTKFWRGSVFGVPEDVQQRNQARAMEAVSMAAPIVYHGSPHRFAPTAKNPLGEFDPTKIGTGEGAQVYGYGHYLAEAKDIGKSYRETLAHKGALDLEYEANKRGIPLSRDARIEFMRQAASDVPAEKTVKNLQNANIEARNLDQTKLAELVKDYKESKQGALYKVDLADEAITRMLDWDKPLSQQAPMIQQNIYNAMLDAGFDKPLVNYILNNKTGNELLNELGGRLAVRNPSPMSANAQTSDFLRKAGIPGIQYLDAGSRGAGTGTRNFVVFPGNEGLLNILGRE